MYQKIKMLCRKNNISVYQLEKDLNFSNGSICKCKNSIPRADKLQKIADHFGVSINYLLENEKEGSNE